MDIKLRPAVLADLQEMQDLFVETIKSTCSGDYRQEQLSAWADGVKNRSRWEHLLVNEYHVVAEAAYRIVGYGALDRGQYVDFLYVHKDYLREGIATRIYRALANESRRLGHARMTADVSITARPFFERQGFKVVRENIRQIAGVEIINFHMSQ